MQIDTRANKPAVLSDEAVDWRPEFPPENEGGEPVRSAHGTQVAIEMTAQYVRGRLSVDEYLKQCAVANPHLRLHFKVTLLKKDKATGGAVEEEGAWQTYARAVRTLPPPVAAIQPHPHGVELGLLMQMLKDSHARTLKGALQEDFSRVSARVALEICERAGLNPKANPTRVAHQEIEALYQAIQETKLMRPPMDCLAPIGEEQILAGLKKKFPADFYTAVTRSPEVYRGNPFLVEVGVACAAGTNPELGAEDPVRVMRCQPRAAALHGQGLRHDRGDGRGELEGLRPAAAARRPAGRPDGLFLHIASVWVHFTGEQGGHCPLPEILKELTFALQGGRPAAFRLSRQAQARGRGRPQAQLHRKIHPAPGLGLQDILALSDKQKAGRG